MIKCYLLVYTPEILAILQFSTRYYYFLSSTKHKKIFFNLLESQNILILITFTLGFLFPMLVKLIL